MRLGVPRIRLEEQLEVPLGSLQSLPLFLLSLVRKEMTDSPFEVGHVVAIVLATASS